MRKMRRFLLFLLAVLMLMPTVLAADCLGVRTEWTASQYGELRCEMTFTCVFASPQQTLSVQLPEGAKDVTVSNYHFKREGTIVSIETERAFSGEQTFRIAYSLPEALKEENNAQSIELPLIPETFPFSVNYFEFSLDLPKAYENEPVILIGENRTTDAVYTLDETRIAGVMAVEVPAGDGLTMTMELGRGYFSEERQTLTRLFEGWRPSLQKGQVVLDLRGALEAIQSCPLR